MRFSNILFIIAFSLSGCAYRLGSGQRAIPGGYKSISIPVFKNKSFEPGIEVGFTNALLQEFQRSKVAKVLDDALSEVRIEGEIVDVKYLSSSKKVAGDPAAPYLPLGTVLTTDYVVIVTTHMRVLRQSDKIEIWRGNFTLERSYSAPQVTIAGLNSLNPLYNQSARRQNIDNLALDMMAEAHNRMTESF
jgi:hypothetical protein